MHLGSIGSLEIIVHFAGCGGHPICESAWAKYWNLREEVEVPRSVKKKLEDGTAEIETFQGDAAL